VSGGGLLFVQTEVLCVFPVSKGESWNNTTTADIQTVSFHSPLSSLFRSILLLKNLSPEAQLGVAGGGKECCGHPWQQSQRISKVCSKINNVNRILCAQQFLKC